MRIVVRSAARGRRDLLGQIDHRVRVTELEPRLRGAAEEPRELDPIRREDQAPQRLTLPERAQDQVVEGQRVIRKGAFHARKPISPERFGLKAAVDPCRRAFNRPRIHRDSFLS